MIGNFFTMHPWVPEDQYATLYSGTDIDILNAGAITYDYSAVR
jgi:hypothetical protein